jgi:aminoglycoside 6'-N-acetyltransferase I
VHDIRIRTARGSDGEQLARMRAVLWPESSAEEHALELVTMLDGRAASTLPTIVFVAEMSGGPLVGFLEAGLRSHADGCDPSHAVGFIEGWYVIESERCRGIGRRLLATAEDWARDRGCVEMASDTWVDNKVSQRVHESMGYLEVDRCVHYRKRL